MTTSVEQRTAELQAMPWQQIKEAAIAAGFEDKPDAELSWRDNAGAIALRELSMQPAVIPVVDEPVPVAPDVVISPTVKGRYNTACYQARGVPYCSVCGEKYRSGDNGSPLCPEGFSVEYCPRLQEI